MATKPDPKTRELERQEAKRRSGPDREPTEEEERLADEHKLDESVAEHAEEMYERGAKNPGEGRLP
jgi:hypothetical protein